MTLQRIREWLAIVLLVLLPFHAFLVTVATKIIAGPNLAPLSSIALWKEGLLVLVVLIALFEVLRKRFKHRGWIDFDGIDACIVGFSIIGVVLGIYNQNILSAQTFYGVRYDLLLPLCFIVLRRVEWSEEFLKKTMWALLTVGVIVVLCGLAALFLPASAFRWLGYNDLHSLYVSGGPLSPFQQIGESGIRRMQSVMSGPNQLGLWLLLPLSIALVKRRWILLLLFLLGIFLTFSRSSWIAAAVIVLIGLWKIVPVYKRWTVFGGVAAAGALMLAGVFAVQPGIITRVTSNKNHIERPWHALNLIVRHPAGLGLGTAGPATNRLRETCIELPDGADASWAKPHPDLCVFVGKSQVQPIDHACNCPLLPENWYLQIGVELGVLGMILYLTMVVLLLIKLHTAKQIFLAFLGVSIAGVFLHSFEDFGVAATLWVLISAYRPHQS